MSKKKRNTAMTLPMRTVITVVGVDDDRDPIMDFYGASVNPLAVGWLMRLAQDSGLLKALAGDCHVRFLEKRFKDLADEVKASWGTNPLEKADDDFCKVVRKRGPAK